MSRRSEPPRYRHDCYTSFDDIDRPARLVDGIWHVGTDPGFGCSVCGICTTAANSRCALAASLGTGTRNESTGR
jgi:hypothetical protein